MILLFLFISIFAPPKTLLHYREVELQFPLDLKKYIEIDIENKEWKEEVPLVCSYIASCRAKYTKEENDFVNDYIQINDCIASIEAQLRYSPEKLLDLVKKDESLCKVIKPKNELIQAMKNKLTQKMNEMTLKRYKLFPQYLFITMQV